MEEQLKKDIEAVVAEIFSQKEEAEMREMTETKLQEAADTIEDLTSVLENKKDELAEVESKLVTANEKITALESELEAAKNEAATSSGRLAETEKALEEIKKDQLANVRMAALEEAKVVRTDKAAQLTKIREMSDEEFAVYKEELESIRASVLTELEASKSTESANKGTEIPDNSKPADEEEAHEEEEASEEEETPPAQIAPGDAMAAALNFETAAIGKDVLGKYLDLGKAMAESMKK